MKLSKFTMIPSVIGLAALIALSPVGASAKGGERASFEELDTNSDGSVTAAELAAHAASRFSGADTDGDGFLTSEELTAAANADTNKRAAKRVERMIDHRDTDDDGKLSAAEMAPSEDRMQKRFERVDSDGNGEISAEEFEQAQEKRGGHRGGKGGKKRGGYTDMRLRLLIRSVGAIDLMKNLS